MYTTTEKHDRLHISIPAQPKLQPSVDNGRNRKDDEAQAKNRTILGGGRETAHELDIRKNSQRKGELENIVREIMRPIILCNASPLF